MVLICVLIYVLTGYSSVDSFCLSESGRKMTWEGAWYWFMAIRGWVRGEGTGGGMRGKMGVQIRGKRMERRG